MPVPSNYTQIYKNYDCAMAKWCHENIKYHTIDENGNDSEKSIFTVFATPERAFAQVAKQIARKKGTIDPIVDAKDLKHVPLPIISMHRNTINFDSSRYVKVKLNKLEYEPTSNRHFGVEMPSPYNLLYQFDVWARNLDEVDDIINQFLLLLRADEVYITVDHPSPFGTRIVRAELRDIVDNSRLETEREKRTLRKTISFEVKGWLCKAEYSHGIVEKVVTDLYDETDSELKILLESIVAS